MQRRLPSSVIRRGVVRAWSPAHRPETGPCDGDRDDRCGDLGRTLATREWADDHTPDGFVMPQPSSTEDIRADKTAGFDPLSETMVIIPLLLDKQC